MVPQPALGELRHLVLRGTQWTVAQMPCRHALGLATTAILARLLAPTDYGLMGMATTLTAFFQVFSDLGLSWATVQRRDITFTEVHTLFWINAAFGTALALMCVAGAPLVARFYARGELTCLTSVCGLGFLFSGVAAQPEALLRRQMRLGALARCNILAHAGGAACGILMAFSGAGVWALVVQTLVAQCLLMAALVYASSYRPGAPSLGGRTAGMLRFGGYLTGYSFLMYFVRNLDNVLVAKFCGAEALCSSYHHLHGLDVTVLRLASAYGPRDFGRVIPNFLEQALSARPLVLFGGDQVLDFVWIDVVVEALLRSGNGRAMGRPVNLGSGLGTTLTALALRVLAETSSKSRLSVRKRRALEVDRFVADTARMTSALGLHPDKDPLGHLKSLVHAESNGRLGSLRLKSAGDTSEGAAW